MSYGSRQRARKAQGIFLKPGQHPQISLEERFWRHVEKKGPDDCWEWKGKMAHAHGKVTYGTLSIGPVSNRRRKRAHILSWEIHNGPIPKGLLVLHSCDNKRCVNPSHLHLGTYSDNNHEAWDRELRPRKYKAKKL